MASSITVQMRLVADVAVLIIDNPPVNALSHAVRQALLQHIAAIAADRAIAAVVLACAGKSFSVGADLAELRAPPI